MRGERCVRGGEALRVGAHERELHVSQGGEDTGRACGTYGRRGRTRWGEQRVYEEGECERGEGRGQRRE